MRPIATRSLSLLLLVASCGGSPPRVAAGRWPEGLTPPVAAEHPHEVASPNGARTDEYYWLRDDTRSQPEVLDHLRAEETYAQAMLAPSRALREALVAEMRARIQEDDSTVPVLDEGWWTYKRYEAGKEYPIHARRRGSMDAPEQILLDANAAAAGHDYYSATTVEVAPGGRLVAWAEDVEGRYQHTIRVKDLETGQVLPDAVAGVQPDIEWAADGRTFLYVANDPVTLLGYKVKKHVVGTDPAADPLVREETDHTFYTGLAHGKGRRYLFVEHQSTTTNEWWYADAADPALTLRPVLARERGHEYDVDHVDGRFVIRTNWQAINFRLVEAPEDAPGDRARWRDVIPHRDDVLVAAMEPFRDFVVVEVRSGGMRRVVVHFWAGQELAVPVDEAAFKASLMRIPAADGTVFRYDYESMVTPPSTYEMDVKTGARTLLKREPVPGYEPAAYATERLEATARDGVKVPVTIAYRKGTPRDGTAPLYLRGYGSYGSSSDPSFSRNAVSLLDRGFVVGTAQVRGGEELGRRWYEDGKLLHKRNTFTDFIDVTEHLIAQKVAARDGVFAAGGSAGGLLMGAIANLRPDLYRGICAHVPFVDVVTTMLDETIPLTSNEYDEWGDPRQKESYDYMLSYSPYDNVRAQAYPAMLVTTSLRDSQVQYYEPAKWVARLRRLSTGKAPLLFHVRMAGSHGGSSGRFRKLEDTALEYGFILQTLGRSS